MKKLIVFLIVITFSLLLAGTGAAGASASDSLNADFLLPSSYDQFYSFTSPLAVYADSDLTAVTEDGKLVLFKDGEISEYSFSNIGVAENMRWLYRYSGNGADFLLMYDQIRIYGLNLNDPLAAVTRLYDCDGLGIYVTGNTLVKRFSRRIVLCTISVESSNLVITDGEEIMVPSSTYENIAAYDAGGTVGYCYYDASGSDHYLRGNLIGNIKVDGKVNYMCVSGGLLYYALDGGLYSLNLGTKAVTLLISTEPESMSIGKLKDPHGFWVFENGLYITDRALKAVQIFNIAAGSLEFSGRAVCAESSYQNRLSANPSAIAELNGTVYIADTGNNRITKIDGDGISTVPLDFSPVFLAVSEDYILTGSATKAVAIDGSGGITEITGETFTGILSAVYSRDNNFYILDKNGTSGKIVKIPASTLIPSVFAGSLENPTDMAADLDKLYILSGGTTVTCYDKQGSKSESLNLSVANAIALQLDLGGNIYTLTDSNTVNIYKGNQLIKSCKIYSSDYLNAFSATGFTLSFSEKPAYFLFGGFVLKTSNLTLFTPADIPLPADVDIFDCLSAGKAEYLSVDSGSTVFSYDYTHIETGAYTLSPRQLTLPLTVIKAGETGDYYYFIDGDRAGFVLKTDAQAFEPEADFSINGARISVAVGIYKYPVISAFFRITVLEPDTAVEVLSKVTLNEREMYRIFLIKDGEVIEGYIPSGFVRSEINSALKKDTFTLQTVNPDKDNRIIIYSDTEKSGVVYTVETKDSVRMKVYEKTGGLARVTYEYIDEDGIQTLVTGFIDKTQIGGKGSNNAKIIAVVALIIISIFLLSVFLFKRYGKKSLPRAE